MLATVLAVVLASVLTVAPGAGASPARDVAVTQQPAECGGYVVSTANFEADTVTSFWIFNPSILFPPTCNQRAVAFCVGPGPIGGNPTINPGEMSTVTCPGSSPDRLLAGGFITQYVS